MLQNFLLLEGLRPYRKLCGVYWKYFVEYWPCYKAFYCNPWHLLPSKFDTGSPLKDTEHTFHLVLMRLAILATCCLLPVDGSIIWARWTSDSDEFSAISSLMDQSINYCRMIANLRVMSNPANGYACVCKLKHIPWSMYSQNVLCDSLKHCDMAWHPGGHNLK